MRPQHSLRSGIVFRAWERGVKVDALGNAQVLASSAMLAWPGVHLEVAIQKGWHVDDLMVDGHYLGYNLSDEDLHFSALRGGAWISGRMPPGTFWINPEGQRFSLRSTTLNHFAGVVVDGRFLDSTMGCHYEVSGGFAVMDTTLGYLMRSMIDEQTLKSLLDRTEAHCTEPITLTLMARWAGLSRAHFAREFKRATGSTPWDHVVALRLARARELLSRGESICDAAAQCGFADQAHLSRVFRQKFGNSPSSSTRSAAAAGDVDPEAYICRPT